MNFQWLLLFLFIGISNPTLGFNSDFREIPVHSSLREIASAQNAYERHMLKTVDYRLNILVPGYMKRSIKNIRAYDSATGEHEIVPKYVFRFWEGIAMVTDKPLDFHIDSLQGRGYFNIKLSTGAIAYTRDGRFRIDLDGRLVTISGNYPVMGHNGYIIVKNDDITVSRSGMLYNESEEVDRIKVTVFDSIRDMSEAFESVTASFFVLTKEIPFKEFAGINEDLPYAILQGFITQANSFDSQDSGMYKNFHKASHNAIVLIIGTMDKVNQKMLAP